MNKDTVDFGGIFVGEVVRKTVSLQNSGALSTCFSLLQLTSPSQVCRFDECRRWGQGGEKE